MKPNFALISKAIAAVIFSSLLHIAGNAQVKQQTFMFDANHNSHLDATFTGGAVSISWPATATLKNNDFVIERSFDQADFKTICYVFAADNTEFSETLTQYKDRSADLNGKVTAYYRIKQTDKNNIISYSEIITVSLK